MVHIGPWLRSTPSSPTLSRSTSSVFLDRSSPRLEASFYSSDESFYRRKSLSIICSVFLCNGPWRHSTPSCRTPSRCTSMVLLNRSSPRPEASFYFYNGSFYYFKSLSNVRSVFLLIVVYASGRGVASPRALGCRRATRRACLAVGHHCAWRRLSIFG